VEIPADKSSSTKPLLSIIIPVLNNANGLRRAVQSVIDQSYKNTELIIIDGGSNDATVDIIRQFKTRIKYWISEKDHGIYHAMNKGIDQCSGDWLLFMGTDDQIYHQNVLEETFSHDNATFWLLYGDIQYSNNKIHVSSYDKGLYLRNTIHHQGAFYSKKCFDDYRFNTHYKILGDYELNLLLYKKRASAKKINTIISKCGSRGISKIVSIGLYREELRMKTALFEWYTYPLNFIWVFVKYAVKKFGLLIR